jgi:hypothetical protein
VICRLFLEEIMKGRSSGDAALTARLQYAKGSKPIDPVDLKTLSQFISLATRRFTPFGSRDENRPRCEILARTYHGAIPHQLGRAGGAA